MVPSSRLGNLAPDLYVVVLQPRLYGGHHRFDIRECTFSPLFSLFHNSLKCD